MAKAMEIVTSGDVQKQFGRYSDEAMMRPIGVTTDGHLRFVMVPADEYRRLRRRERVAGGWEDITKDMIEAIRSVEPGPKSEKAEASLRI